MTAPSIVIAAIAREDSLESSADRGYGRHHLSWRPPGSDFAAS